MSTIKRPEMIALPDVGRDWYQCVDCGAVSRGQGEADIPHEATCQPGEAQYWRDYYNEAAQEELEEGKGLEYD